MELKVTFAQKFLCHEEDYFCTNVNFFSFLISVTQMQNALIIRQYINRNIATSPVYVVFFLIFNLWISLPIFEIFVNILVWYANVCVCHVL